MDLTTIKIGNEHTSKNVNEVKFRRVTTQDDNDVVFMFKNVLCFGISKVEKELGEFSDKQDLSLCLWHHANEQNPSQETVESVLNIQDLHSNIYKTLYNNNKVFYRKCCPFKYYSEKLDEEPEHRILFNAGDERRSPDEFLSCCNFYPRIQPNRVPILNSKGEIVDREMLNRECRVNVAVRYSVVSKSQHMLNSPIMDVVAIECLETHCEGISDNKEVLKLMRTSLGEEVFDELGNTLQRCGAWLTGSYILQVIHGEQYENSDIDIFCPSKYASTLIGHFFNSGGVITKIYCSDYKFMKVPIENVIDIEFKERNFQIISILGDNVEEHILNGFDFDFCMVRWNGNELLPKDLTNISKKIGKYNPNPRFNSNRVNKYKDRGYTITSNFDSITKSMNIVENKKADDKAVLQMLGLN